MPQPAKSGRQSVRLFESDFCEWFSHVHPITPLVLWTPVVAFLFYRAYSAQHLSVTMISAVGALGLFVWTFVEYVLHRFVFHMNPGDNRFLSRLQYIMHGNHHDIADDPTRLVMPPIAGVCIAIVLYFSFSLVIGEQYLDAFFGAFLIGYLCYDYIHFSVHHFTPRTPVGRFLKQQHMLHHFVTHNARWGVSNPLWDYVFGTLDEKEETESTA